MNSLRDLFIHPFLLIIISRELTRDYFCFRRELDQYGWVRNTYLK